MSGVGRSVLVTGLDTFWGARVAHALEAKPDVEMLLGLGTNDPKIALERTEFVRADQKYSILSRIVQATQVDTIVHTFLETNSTRVSPTTLHEINVIGTLNLLAAAGAPGSSVRQVVVKSSTHVYGADERDPVWFREEDERTGPVRTRLERSLLEVETLVRDFADDNPHLTVTVLRFANVLGSDIVTPISHDLRQRILPCVAGYDPLLQFVEEDDVVRSLEHVTLERIPGVFNIAGAGKLPWSEVASICSAYLLPLPPFRPSLFLQPLIRLGLLEFPPEMEGLARYGRGVDTSRFLTTGFEYRYTSAGAVRSFARANNLRRALGRTEPEYRYEREVEQFFRHSPSVAVRGTET
ncbi:MAG: NAD-dependent epimerase/dehydratase family protein [Acidimicrobiales bacterium]|nr:NAD-dependent epimerase/dehydratase family protein [Acidimicrobiales bacterium]